MKRREKTMQHIKKNRNYSKYPCQYSENSFVINIDERTGKFIPDVISINRDLNYTDTNPGSNAVIKEKIIGLMKSLLKNKKNRN